MNGPKPSHRYLYGAVHKRRRQLGEGVKNWSKLPTLGYVLRKLPTWRSGGQKSGKIADVVYGWSLIWVMNHGFVNVKFTIYVRTTVQQQDITTATTHLSNHNSTLRMLNLVFEPSNNRSVSQSCISMTSLLKHTVAQPKICRLCLLGLLQLKVS